MIAPGHSPQGYRGVILCNRTTRDTLSRMKLLRIFGALLLLPNHSYSQATPVKPAPTTTFQSVPLDLTLNYPASLMPEKLPTPEEQHAATASRQPADEKSEYRRVDQCTDSALQADRHDPGTTGTVAFFGNGKKPEFTVDPVINASLTIARVGLECMPAEYLTQKDNLVAGMAQSGVEGKNLKPIDQPIWYDIGKTRVHFAAAESIPATDPKTDKIEPKHWLAVAAFISNGNIVTILFDSDNLAFLNDMIHSKLTVGKETPSTLFPADIGGGKPIELKP
jgi:hypothetical protein